MHMCVLYTHMHIIYAVISYELMRAAIFHVWNFDKQSYIVASIAIYMSVMTLITDK